jgi:hypothetical protein
MNPVLVIWRDHHCSNETITKAEAEQLRPLQRQAVGWLFAEGNYGITLVMDVGDEKNEGDPHLFLAHEMIEEIIPLHAGPLPVDYDE